MKKNLDILAAAGMLILAVLALARAQGGGFQFFGPLSRVITPNGNYNKYAIFCFDNPADFGVDGAIFTLLGSEVADLGPASDPALAGCPNGQKPQSLNWDGRSNGSVVHSGVYVYHIRAEGLSFTGTLLVVR